MSCAGSTDWFGTLSIVVAGFQAPPAGPPTKALSATKIEKVKDNLYIITGSGVGDTEAFSGGNTAVFITDAGVVVVDTKLPGWGPTILERIKSVTSKPVTTIINTHTHSDHTGSNEGFRRDGRQRRAREHQGQHGQDGRVQRRQGQVPAEADLQRQVDTLPAKMKSTFIISAAGHTNGDTFVVFPAIKTMHVGDMFAWKALPYIDAANGGSVSSIPQTLAKGRWRRSKTSIPSSMDTFRFRSWNDLKEYADFTQDFADYARNSLKDGKTVDQAAAEYKVPSRFKGLRGQP